LSPLYTGGAQRPPDARPDALPEDSAT
jgi:hypothetical protein